MRLSDMVESRIMAAFLAGTQYALTNARMVNDGQGHCDLVEPDPEELENTARTYSILHSAYRAGSAR